MRATQDQPLVSDDLLAELTHPDFDAQRGEFDAETRAMLATALPEICRELLTFRRTARNKQAEKFKAQRQMSRRRLETARRKIRASDPIPTHTLAAACKTLLKYSTDSTERAAASDVLAQLQEAV